MDNILVLGNGAREHTIVDILLKSKDVNDLYMYPGNDAIFTNELILKTDIINFKMSLVEFCLKKEIKMVVVGSETLLVDGIYDYLNSYNINCLGPNKEGATIEGSKIYSKNLMKTLDIPTADYIICNSYDDFKNEYDNKIKDTTKNYVVKASGLAGGKGVIVTNNHDELIKAVKSMLIDNKFGEASNEIIIEEKLEGQEVSIIGFCNGKTVDLMPQSQDYKKIYDNDFGLNTGGMGSHAPVYILNEEELNMVKEHMGKVVLKLNYKGILYAGIMKTNDGIYFLEFNCRLGDPEAQVLLNLLDTDKTDLYTIFKNCLFGNELKSKWKYGFVSNLILSHVDYPSKKSNEPLKMNIDFTKIKENNIKLYWSNVFIENKHKNDNEKYNNYFTTGGRVLSMVRYDNSFYNSFKVIYNSTKYISYKDQFFRRDIGLNSYYLSNNVSNIRKKVIKIGILGSTKGTSIQMLIDMIKSKEINASIELIVSNKKDAYILERAKNNNINFTYLSNENLTREEYDRKIVNLMRIYGVELVILVGYMKIVTPVLIDEYGDNIINVHPSLLPKYGGKMDLDVHQEVINNNEKFTGCTIHKVIKEVDKGDIVLQKQMLINTEDPDILKTQVQHLESIGLIDVINIYLNKETTYKSSGVDIEEGNNLVENIKDISDNIGGFSALYKYKVNNDNNNNNDIILGAATDGVGTKLEIANKMNKFDTIGIDLVAMSVNDLYACGIRPLFFLDYIAIDKMNTRKCKAIIDGVNKGCKMAKCELVGGETAEMKGIYLKDKFDIAGFAVGVQEYKLDPVNNINEGNYIYGMRSSGIHSNGYTLINKLLEDNNYDLNKIIEPTKIYNETLDYLEKYKDLLVGISHITGGGYKDNISRILPHNLTFKLIEWEFSSLFKWIQKTAKIDRNEMLNTFNCGYGMIFIFNEKIKEPNLQLIGEIIKK